MISYSELLKKKVVGVPVAYLALGAVTILAVVAWRMKSAPAADETDVAETDPSDIGGPSDPTDSPNYQGTLGNGTVVVQNPPVEQTLAEPDIDTNDKWVSKGAAWLVAQHKATGADALRALTKFVQGEQLSFDEGVLRDTVIEEKGPPPEALGTVGGTAEQPAKRQFSAFPGKHTVKNNNDNTWVKLATLYYGTALGGDALIKAANTSFGTGGSLLAGTTVTIPAYTVPVYFTATQATRYFSNIASKNGISTAQIVALNPGLQNPAAVGKKVRVH